MLKPTLLALVWACLLAVVAARVRTFNALGPHSQPNTPVLAMRLLATDDPIDYTTLVPGEAREDVLEQGANKYYKVDIPENNEENLSIFLSPQDTSDPELYASPDHPDPSDSDGDSSSSLWGGDGVFFNSTQLHGKAQVYVKVFCRRGPCTYTLAATFSHPIELGDGVPQTGFVMPGSVEYFYLDVAAGNYAANETFSVDLSMIQDYVNVYVLTTPADSTAFPNPDNPSADTQVIWWYAPHVITLTPTEGAPLQRIAVAVKYAATGSFVDRPAMFTLMVSSTDASKTLTSGVPRHGWVRVGSTNKYKFKNEYVGCRLSVAVTAQSGDPDLVVTDPSGAERSSVNPRGLDFLSYPNATRGEYSIKVIGYAAEADADNRSSYNILVVLQCPNEQGYAYLLEGVSQYGVLETGEYDLYQITLPINSAREVVITLDAIEGDPDVYIRRAHNSSDVEPPSSANADWKALLPGSDVITIQPTEVTPGTTLLIAIRAYQRSEYRLTVDTRQVHTQLSDGMPLSSTLPARAFAYFSYRWEREDDDVQDLQILVTQTYGDPDIYVAHTPFPDANTKQWFSLRYGDDIVTIPKNENLCESYPCVFYIGVCAYSTTEFTIVASQSRPIRLSPGVEQADTLRQGQHRAFYLDMTSRHSDLTLRFSHEQGRSNVYAAWNRAATTTDNDYQATFMTGTASLTVPYSADACPSDQRCQLFFLVEGATSPKTVLTILPTLQEVQVRIGNAASQEHSALADDMVYFIFDGRNYFDPTSEVRKVNVLFALTALTGDPDLYISTTEQKPGPGTNNTDSSTSKGSDAFEYVNVEPAVYYIGVHAASSKSTKFSLIVVQTQGTSSVLPLRDGQPQDFAINAGAQSQLFEFRPSDIVHADLTISVTQLTGKVDMFINSDTNQIPDDQHSDYSRKGDVAKIVQIERPDQPVYRIHVVPTQRPAVFQITAQTDTTLQQLRDGVPVTAQIGQRGMNYFYVIRDAVDKDITISVTTIAGDPDLYVSNTEAVPGPDSDTSKVWYSTAPGDDSITITAGDVKHSPQCLETDPAKLVENPCVYYVGVYGYQASSYQIVASFERPVALTNGRTITDSTKTAAKHYTLTLPEPTLALDAITVSLTTSQGFARISVYTDPSQPDAWTMDNSLSSGTITIRRSDNHPQFCDGSTPEHPCVYHIKVEPVRLFDNRDTVYSLTVSTSETSIELRQGVSIVETLQSGKYRYFYFHNTQLNGEAIFAVTALSGDPDVFGSRTDEHPNEHSMDESSTRWGGDVLYVKNLDVGNYYLSVKAAGSQTSTFSITAYQVTTPANETNFVRLLDGLSQTGAVQQGKWVYYQFRLTPDMIHVQVELTRIAGDPDLYVNVGGQLPTMGTADCISRSTLAKDECEMQISDVNSMDDDDKVVTIGVYGYQTSIFSLTANSNLAHMLLINGEPRRVSLTTQGSALFAIVVDSIENDLEISATVSTGVPTIYVSPTQLHPNADTPDTDKSEGRDNYFVYISKERLDKATYYINVHCPGPCSYAIRASFNERYKLLDGIPVQMTLAANARRYFSMTSPTLFDYKDVVLTLISVTGTQVSMYASYYDEPRPDDPEHGQLVNATTSSQVQAVVSTQDTPASTFFDLKILVVAGSEPATFSLQAKSERALVALRPGVTYRDQASPDMPAKFVFENTYENAAIEVRVLPLSGDGTVPKIYGAVGHVPDPHNETTVNFKSEDSQPSVSLYASSKTHADLWKLDPNFYFLVDTRSAEGVFFAVTLIVTPLDDNADVPSVLLIPGTSLPDGLPEHGSRTYRVFSGNSTSMIVSVERHFGDPELFVTTNGDFFDPEHAKSSDVVNGLTVKFENQERNIWYDIRVNTTSPTLYTITARIPGVSVVNLVPGLSITNTLDAGQHSFYYVETHDRMSKLRVLVTALTGDPDLFISSTIQNPTHEACSQCQNCCQTGRTLYGEDITIEPPLAGVYYIGVQGYTATTYRITAFTASAQLMPNVPQYGIAYAGQHTLYLFTVNDPKEGEIRFTLTQNNGPAPAQMFITTTPDVIPDADNSMWSSTNPQSDAGGLRGDIVLRKGMPNVCHNCVYRISVVGAANSGTVDYAITVTNGEHVTLQAGAPYRGKIERGEKLYFRAQSENPNHDISIDAYGLTHTVTAYVSKTEAYPSAANVPENRRGQHINIPHHDADTYGLFFIAVELAPDAPVPATAFTLTFSNSNVLVLLGEPIQTQVVDKSYFFFKVDKPSADNRIVLELTDVSTPNAVSGFSRASLSGSSGARSLAVAQRNMLRRALDARHPSSATGLLSALDDSAPRIYITTDSTYSHPDASTPKEVLVHPDELANWNWGQIVIPLDSHDPNVCTDCHYFVGLEVPKPAVVSVDITTTDTIATLEEGVERRATATSDEIRYFALNSAHQHDKNITVFVEPCLGKVQHVFASYSRLQPDHTNANYNVENNFGGAAQLGIPARADAASSLTAYTIGVQGPKSGHGLEFLIQAVTTDYVRPTVENSNLEIVELGPKPKFSFIQAEPADDLEYEVRYDIVDKESEGNLYTACGLQRAASHSLVPDVPASKDQRVEFELADTVDGTSYFVNVIATSKNTGRTVVYSPVRFKAGGGDGGGGGGSGDKKLKSLLFIIIPVGVTLALLVVYLFLKNRRLTKELEVEMQDVPKAAVRKAVRGPTFDVPNVKDGKNYSQLLAEDEDDANAAAYAPPDPPIQDDPYANAVL